MARISFFFICGRYGGFRPFNDRVRSRVFLLKVSIAPGSLLLGGGVIWGANGGVQRIPSAEEDLLSLDLPVD